MFQVLQSCDNSSGEKEARIDRDRALMEAVDELHLTLSCLKPRPSSNGEPL